MIGGLAFGATTAFGASTNDVANIETVALAPVSQVASTNEVASVSSNDSEVAVSELTVPVIRQFKFIKFLGKPYVELTADNFPVGQKYHPTYTTNDLSDHSTWITNSAIYNSVLTNATFEVPESKQMFFRLGRYK